jgi:hypothetical protein
MSPEQVVFDTAVRALIKQGRSGSEYGICQYRASNGTKCAVGHLISDAEYYQHSMDDLRLSEVMMVLSPSNPLKKATLSFVQQLQNAHDQASSVEQNVDNYSGPPRPTFVEAFKSRARKLAHDWNLSTAVLDE